MTNPSPTAPGHLVLVGHGMVGQRFLEALFDSGAGARWRVTVLAEEPRPAYDRVHLTSWFAGTTAEELSLCDDDFLTGHGIELRLGDPVTSVDRAARTVTTAAGHTLGYDALVLATGSYPFVPPVPGHDATGCHVYRTLDDVAGIRAEAAHARTGVVVGGGLLGLEAAGALTEMGLDTHVVEFAPRLMALQVDEGGGQLLRRRIEELGVTVHTGAGTQRIDPGPDGRVAAMELSDGTVLDTDLVVFSAGVRPRDQLARDCGLPVGERGGITVDARCRTADPHIWAIGECAQAADGRVYGLVAPGYAMAEAAARDLTGHDASFTGGDTSTKLKLLGVDVASFGDPHGTAEGALEVLYANSRAGVYKKLVLGADGALLGGVLVGDTESYGTLRPLVGSTRLPAPPERLLLPATGGGAPAGPGALPDDAVICSCHNVAKGVIRRAVTDQGCAGVTEVKKCTKAGTGCGSCLKTVTAIVESELAASGAEVAPGLCEHFTHTRAELYEIVRAKGITTFSRLVDEHGTGEGCEVCKPVVASILASLTNTYVLDGEQAALQDTNDHVLANLQRNGSYSVVPRVPGGEITPEGLITIGEIARDFGLYTKITGGQRIDLFGARLDDLPRIWRRLVDAGFESGHAYGKALRTVKSCVGETWCRYGVQDSVALAIELELRYRGLRSPHKLKAAVSGCARECAEAQSKDFGVIATSAGWNLYVGGNGGMTPRHADLLAADLDRDTLIRTIDRFLMFYIRTADRLERTAPWLERLDGGLDHLREVVLDDSLGICADLDELMQRHIETYQDEWAATLADPDRLRRFVSFANAPDVPDPTVRFVPERGQIRPARPEEAAAPDGELVGATVIAGPRLEVRPR
ncbi:nitrite reductase large subunit NirB [Streptantibioticus cattleyicolor]|uniref:assimilatory sulfite reductase (ferredoxin) n=1 Tax=Streptantibioticus cattleyicolor (strain ATCC 35852 / DSM 46488 / JCM 4925 / NBRC 14057 / NRRL 8057) TaxID=1003195 RepID=F8JNG4_STREN|nr:nitrite reductase large subunit NirB [Streptantibioticus cattleyicolor]AEW99069.1 nitrite reductase (NAD(P)H) large subunit [Streptantibioticus cattleyicolor NRRL 8057 = DSM 46488]CCB71884.1 Nitrite reductase [NAD(P)H] large subunit [Streptantibioticus cattleyicolor NRRL 8057 = DSM 46488]